MLQIRDLREIEDDADHEIAERIAWFAARNEAADWVRLLEMIAAGANARDGLYDQPYPPSPQ